MYAKLKTERVRALKEKDSVAKIALSMVMAKAQDAAKKEHREVSDKDCLVALKSEIKIAVEMIKNKNDEKTVAILDYLESLLPKQAADEVVIAEIKRLKSEGATMKDMGMIMGVLTTKFPYNNGKTLNAHVRKVLIG